jgi:hypothetical protein
MAIEHLGEVVVGMKTDEVIRLLENVQAGGGIIAAAGGGYFLVSLDPSIHTFRAASPSPSENFLIGLYLQIQ